MADISEKKNRICLVEVDGKKCGHVVPSNAGIYNHLRLNHKGKKMQKGKTYDFTSREPKVVREVAASLPEKKSKAISPSKKKSGKKAKSITAEMRQKVYEMSLEGKSNREIGLAMNIGKSTAGAIIRKKRAEVAQ